MIYGSVCSGIEATTVAWHPLGWRPAFFSEIDPFPSAVLAHRWPGVENLGDFTAIEAGSRPIDLLVGGTPCQDFSVAGLRRGLAGDRGNLTLQFLRLVDRLRPVWVVWENVPGVLSSHGGRDFGAFLGGLEQLGYGWAYRTLDAQYVGGCALHGDWRSVGPVPQRRRRVFVVACAGVRGRLAGPASDRDVQRFSRLSAAVLFERACLSGGLAAGGGEGEDVAGTLACGSGGRGWRAGGDEAGSGQLIPSGAVARPLTASEHGYRSDLETETFVIQSASRGEKQQNGLGVRADAPMFTLNGGDHHAIALTLKADGFDASEDGTGRGVPIVPFDTTQVTSPGNYPAPRPGDPCHPLAAGAHPPAIAFCERGRADGRNLEWSEDVAYSQRVCGEGGGTDRFNIMTPQMAVRRLTPVECERLMGLPDDYTLVPYRNGMAKDGPRYKAIGNSIAVYPLRWIARRIEMVEAIVP